LNETDVEILKAYQLFPCNDELTVKSIFKIAIKHQDIYTVLSNMPIQTKYNKNDMIWTEFEKSFLMSAQHITVVIITFSNRIINRNTNVTIWCKQSFWKHIVYAHDVVQKVVPHFRQNYFTELSKLDIVVSQHIQNANGILGLLLIP